jgi:hypothetical protein
MLNKSQKAFLTLCESIVSETSNIPKAIGTGMAATALMKHIHSNMSKSHTMEVKPVDSIDLAWIKKYGGFYIIQGDLGYVALIGDRYGMKVAGVKKGNQQVASENASGVPQVRKFIKEYAGKLEKYWRSGESYKDNTYDLKSRRAALKTVNRAEVSADSLFERFRPLFFKAGQAAVADVRGVAMNMLKSGNYSDLTNKINHLRNLETYVSYLEDTGGKFNSDDPNERYTQRYAQDFFKKALGQAITLAAQHFSGAEFDPTSNIDDDWEAKEKLFSDIQNGDTKKLSALLTYFKNGLVR